MVHFCTSAFLRNVAYKCAYVKLDGADTRLFHKSDTRDVRPGMRVKAVFRAKRSGLISDLVFVPA